MASTIENQVTFSNKFEPLYVTSFPENVEIGLLTFINLSYMTFTIPFKVVYDKNKREYCVHISSSRKIICLLRLLLMSFLTFHGILFNFMVGQSPGPMRVLLGGIYVGGSSTAMFYLYSMLSSNFQIRLVKFINFIKEKSSFANSSRSNTKLLNIRSNKKLLIMGEAIFYYSLSVFIYTIFAANFTLKPGLENALETVYSFYSQNGPMSLILAPYPLLKRVASYIFLCSQIDQDCNVGMAHTFSILLAKMLQASCTHFIRSVHDASNYCVVTKEETLKRFQDLRKAFTGANNLWKFVLCSVIVTQCVQFSVGLVWTFRSQQNIINYFGTYTTSFCFAALLHSSAKAFSNLSSVILLLSCQPSNNKGGFAKATYELSLKERILAYEINAGAIGFGASNVFLLSYSFIGSIALNILSNSAMVVQSMDFLEKVSNKVAKTKM